MNGRSPDFDWNHARTFLAVVEGGSLTNAARALRLTQPTVGRQIAAFEAQIGAILFERAGRALRPTETGLALAALVRNMEEAAAALSLAAASRSDSVAGRVRITASDVMCAHVLPPAVARLREAAPLLHLDLLAANDIRDLLRREADVAIRHVRPDQPDLLARLAGERTAHFFASSAYLDRRGRPVTAAELAGHDFIGFGDVERMLSHLAPLALPIGAGHVRLSSESGVVGWEMARAGLGVVAMMDEVGDATPGMERVLPAMALGRFPVWLVTHRELRTSRRIRVVFDLLFAFLAGGGAPGDRR